MNKIDIYLVNYHQLNLINNCAKYFKYLNDEELLKINNLENNADKANSLIGLLLVKAFSHNSEIKKNEYGKPYLLNNEFYFNISHSNEITAIAISNSNVGIDIEFNQDNFDYKNWTIKESFFKLIGKGLSMNDENIDIKDNIITYKNKDYFFNNYDLDEYSLTVSYEIESKINIKYLNNYELIEILKILEKKEF